MEKDIITMNRKQFHRYQVIQSVIDGKTTIQEAAVSLNLSTRQIKRLKKEVSKDGAGAIVHGNAHRTPSNAISDELVAKIMDIRSKPPFDQSNFAHFRELLDEEFDIQISYGTLHKLLTSNGIVSPKKRRRFKPHRRRSRKSQAGLLVQIDATPFEWFRKDRKRYALHGAIDDATGQILALYLTRNECLKGYFSMMERLIRNYGVPVSIYADRHTIFQSPQREKADISSDMEINDTQFGRALRELGIELISARSPQAKGRIERLWQTLQSRLPIEFELNGIDDPDKANKFLETYIYKFNSQFAVEAKETESMFVKMDDPDDLKYILCVKEERTVDAGGVFSYKGRSYMVHGPNAVNIFKGARIKVLINEEYGIAVQYKGIPVEVLQYIPPKRKTEKPKKARSRSHPQTIEHPWKSGSKMMYSEDLNYTDMLTMIDEVMQAPY